MEKEKLALAGFLSGSIQCIIGHPFDTKKVLIQSKKNIYPLTLKNLYKGLSYPLLTQSIVNSIMFTSYEFLKFNEFNNIVSGGGAGILTGLILTPIELLKINKQVNINSYNKIFRGLNATLGREIIGTSIYFSVYANLKSSDFSSFTSGGIAGCSSWIVSYPLDVIKTRIQSSPNETYKNAINKGHLYKGIGICLARAFLVNACGFWTYEFFKNNL